MASTRSGDNTFLLKLRTAIREFAPRSVVAAVSGGPDSVALLLGLGELREECGFSLRAVHVHHGWRGAEADGDAEFVLALARSHDVFSELCPVTADHQEELAGKSKEEGARDVRYQLLKAAAARYHFETVAFGHTADDQVETVLHHLVRGTGLAGLAGMPAERELSDSIRLIRPMLAVSRAEVLQFLETRQQSYRQDATNEDVKLTRNRIRHKLLPLLRTEFNPRVDQALQRLAQQAGEASELLESLAKTMLDRAVLQNTDSECRLDLALLSQQPDVVIRHTFRRLWIQRGWPRQEMGQREWDRLATLIRQPGSIHFPGGICARRESGPLILWRRAESR